MNKRQAKQRACLSAAIILQNALNAGWETDREFPDSDDESKFLAALDELIEELERRGERSEDDKG